MFYWGYGPTLGLLACLGYGVFVLGAFFLWRNRAEFTFWMDDELSSLRRNFSRYVPVGPFYERRGESRLRVIPASFFTPSRSFPAAAFPGVLSFSS